MKFICEYHKGRVVTCRRVAARLWQDAFDAGLRAMAGDNWCQACYCFGSALDIAFLVFLHHDRETARPEQTERVKSSCQNLAICLYQLGNNTEADAYLMDLHYWLAHT